MLKIHCLILGLSLSFPIFSNTTLIESSVLDTNDTQQNYYVESADTQSASDAAMLFHIPGLTVTENNGPLGKSEVRYRGLSGARFKIDLEGLSLNNPLFGFSDANAMFLFAAQELQTGAQSLSITLPTIDRPFAKGIMGYGSHNSLKLGASAATPLGQYSSIYAATQFVTTNGKFAFSSPDSKPGPDNNFYRENNDQERYQALIKFAHNAPTRTAHVLAAFNSHEGGVPGFAFSPTKNLRNKALFAGLSVGYTQKINKAEFKLSLANSLFNFQSTDIPNQQEKFLTSTHEFNFSIKNLSLPSWLEMELGQIIIVEQSYDQKHSRMGGGLFIKRDMHLQGRMKPTLRAYFSMVGYHGVGLLFKKDFSLTIQPRENISVTAGFARTQRLPTFMELYAQNSFFVGNENLQKESTWDFQVASNFRLGEHTRLNITGFYGHLSDLIIYEPFMGTRLRPKNIAIASRMGIDLGINTEPFSWLMIESKNSLLRTRVAATKAPLPQAPMFLGLSRVRLGPEDIATLTLQTRYRTESNANMFGTKTTKGYILLDALVSTPIAHILTLSLSVSNIFNVKNARDTYEMPIPGTVFFAQIEVGNS
jgi:outer membrane cobalamin receptor